MHWCEEHPRYEAKREPNSLCGRCYELWYLRCPERKEDGITVRLDSQTSVCESGVSAFGKEA